MSLEKMAKEYSKKWKVSEEEAKEKIKAFLEEKPEKDKPKEGPSKRAAPSTEDVFPEPLGPLSRKIQDINQAALSTAWTRRSLLEMSQPPEELTNLRGKVESIEKVVDYIMGDLGKKVSDMKETLEAKRAEEEREQFFKDLDEKLITPLREKVEAIEKAGAGDRTALKELTPESIVEASQSVTKEARSWLEGIGFKVELPTALTKEQVEAMMEEREKKWREEHDVERESRVETAKIDAAKEVVTTALDKVLGVFEEPLRQMMEGTIERRAASTTLGEPPAPGSPPTPGAPPEPGSVKEWGPELTPIWSEKPPEKKKEEKKA